MSTQSGSSLGHSLPLILASSSPYRAKLLRRLCNDFITESPNIDESQMAGEQPESLCMRLAETKATVIANRYPKQWVISSDQVACCEDRILSKPGNFENAFQQLQFCSGKRVFFHTAVTLSNQQASFCKTESSSVVVKFRDLSEEAIHAYLQADNPLDCAGSFKVEEKGVLLFESVSSQDPTALEGLPLIVLCRLFRSAGIDPFSLFTDNRLRNTL